MPRFSANISTLFRELPFVDRIPAAADAGFRAVECQFPYGVPAAELRRRLVDRDLELVVINAPAGKWDDGERGLTLLEDSSRFRASVEDARVYAAEAGCTRVHVLTGTWTVGEPPWSRCIDRLGVAADRLSEVGVTMLVEALNPEDVPGYVVRDVASALLMIDAIGRTNVALQYDLYHAHRTEADPFATLRSAIGKVAHVQFAGVSERGEPDERCARLWDELDDLGYTGWAGAEYVPVGATSAGLGWWRERSGT